MIPIEVKEKLRSFDALVLLAERGLIDYDAYWKAMNKVMGYSVMNHMLGTTGLKELRKEIEELPHMGPIEVIYAIRDGKTV